MAPLGASCFLLFGVPDAPFAQTRNVIAGHLLSSLVGLVFFKYIGVSPVEMGLAVGIAIGLMLVTRTSHPPAGADPLVIMIVGNLSWGFLITPVLVSTVILVLIALVFNNVGNGRSWPRYWYEPSIELVAPSATRSVLTTEEPRTVSGRGLEVSVRSRI